MQYLSYGDSKTQPKRKIRKTMRKQVYKTNSQMKKGFVAEVKKANS